MFKNPKNKTDNPLKAGSVEVYRYGLKAQSKLQNFKEPNYNWYISLPADGGNYWKIGVSENQYGPYACHNGKFFRVNRGGFLYAKLGTEQADDLLDFIDAILDYMKYLNANRTKPNAKKRDLND